MQVLKQCTDKLMKQFMAIIEKCPNTNLFVGYVPGLPGAHSQAETLEQLNVNLREVIEMLLEDNIQLESEFVGTQLIAVS